MTQSRFLERSLAPPAAPQDATATEHVGVSYCANCQTVLQGRFCHACGQSGTIRNSIGDLLRDLYRRLVDYNLGSLLGLARLIFAPGRMTADWIAGRRVGALSPWHAIMLALPIYFLAPQVVNFDNRPGDLAERIARDAGHWRAYGAIVLATLGPAHFAGVNLLLMFRQRSQPYAHLVFTIYQFAFILLLTPAAGALMCISDDPMGPTWQFALVLFIHSTFHLRGAYGLSWFGAAWRTMVLLFIDLFTFGSICSFATMVLLP